MLSKVGSNRKKTDLFIFLLTAIGIAALVFVFSILFMENNGRRVTAGKISSEDSFNISLNKFKALKKVLPAQKEKGVYAERLAAKALKGVLYARESVSYNNSILSKALNLPVLAVYGDSESRVVTYKGMNGTYQFIQCHYNDKIYVRPLINGRKKVYDSFYMIAGACGKKLICIGNNYEFKPNNAFVSVLSYQNFEFNADKDSFSDSENNISPWDINEFEGTIGLGNEFYKNTVIAGVRDSGRDIYVKAAAGCIRFMGYDPGILKLMMTDKGFVPFRLEQKQIPAYSSSYIPADKAIKCVMELKDAKRYCNELKKVDARPLFSIEQSPYRNNKYWKVDLAQDSGDNIAVYNVYYIDARSGKYVKKLYDWN